MIRLPKGSDIKELRKKVNLTQAELAEKAGVSQSLIARIENESVDPRLSTLRKIFQAIMSSMREQVTLQDVMVKDITTIQHTDSVSYAVNLMKERDYSQLPVVDGNGAPIGTVQESTILQHLLTENQEDLFMRSVKDVMEDCLPCLPPSTSIEDAYKLFISGHPGVLVIDRGKLVGIVTKIDVITKMSKP